MTNNELAGLLEEAARRLRAAAGSIPSTPQKKVVRAGLSAAQLAAEIGVSSRTVRNYAKSGLIPGKNFGGKRWVFDRDKARRALSLHFGNPAERDLSRKR